MFLILFPSFKDFWLFWRQELFLHHVDYVLLELRMPREVKRSPMAMEQVLAAIHSLRNSASDPQAKWMEGEVPIPYSLEIVSFGGEVHFYVRAFRKQQNLFEAAFFSYYPDVEVVEVDDYIDKLPENMTEVDHSGHDLFGSELLLAKDEAYPIRSYLEFESPDENKQYDPISHILEVLGQVKREEFVGIQFVVTPADEAWQKEGAHLVDELRENKAAGAHGGGAHGGASMKVEFPHILPIFPVEAHGEKKEDSFSKAFLRTPGETDVLKAVEENISKPGFETVVRYMYLSPKEMFSNNFARRSVTSAFNQYASTSLNAFKPNYEVTTSAKIWIWPHWFPKKRAWFRKERMLANYRHREVAPHSETAKRIMSRFFSAAASEHVVLSTRSLATLFHPPTYQVLTAPHVKRVESRKAGPPAGLAIFGGEEEVEKFR